MHAPGWVGRVCKAKLVLGGRWCDGAVGLSFRYIWRCGTQRQMHAHVLEVATLHMHIEPTHMPGVHAAACACARNTGTYAWPHALMGRGA
jgi:hypothetical protein